VEAVLREFTAYATQQHLTSIQVAGLASAIANSGTRLSHSVFPISNVHSTGAPGSLSTLLVPTLVAATGFYVPQISISGSVSGAIDSLESIPGYKSGLNSTEFAAALAATRLVQVGHGGADYAVADNLLWTVRKTYGAVKVPSLIAGSLLGKMLAAGARHGVVDVRVGPSGNAGNTLDAAVDTSQTLVSAARLLDMRVSCLLSDATVLQWHAIGRLGGHDGPQSVAGDATIVPQCGIEVQSVFWSLP
jgi:thymidine phosphorylase